MTNLLYTSKPKSIQLVVALSEQFILKFSISNLCKYEHFISHISQPLLLENGLKV